MIPKISEAEWQIMKLIWKSEGTTSGEIIKEISINSDWKITTIKSLINRLLKKEAIGFEKRGREYFYFPLIKESECIKEESKSFINRFFNGSINTMLVNFVKEEALSKEEIKELREILNNAESNSRE
ncbi:MAG: BlaI/MecI/CopY family transcriptional regulator [Clostridium sp.]